MKNKLLGLMLFSVIGYGVAQSAFAGVFTTEAKGITQESNPLQSPLLKARGYNGPYVCWSECFENCIQVSRDFEGIPITLAWSINTDKSVVHCYCIKPDNWRFEDIFRTTNSKCTHLRHGEGYEDRMRSVDATSPPRAN